MSMSFAAASAASAPLAFRSDAADVGFPWAGAALLVLLAVVAVAARWQSRRRGANAGGWLSRWLPHRGGAQSPEGNLSVSGSVRLDGQTQLHTIRWGHRELLVATSLNVSPVLLDSRDTTGPGTPS
jgi:hypothetical protein